MLKLIGIQKSFEKVPVLRDIHLEFAPGKIHILLGASGCGKSTLLRIVLGLLKPDAGEVIIGTRKMSPENQRSLVKEMGYVPQDGGLFPHFTARENVCLPARLAKWPEKHTQDRVSELAHLVHLDESLLEKYPSELSGGQRQRVGLMRGLMLSPNWVLMDEPLGALDPMVRASLQSQLKEIFSEAHCGALLVTHDISEAAYLGDSITLLNQGRVAQQGAFSELIETPAHPFVREFLLAQRPAPELSKLENFT